MSCVYLNGEFIAPEEAKISVFDRGFLFADSVYEVIPVYAGNLFQAEQHLERLEQSLAAISLDAGKSRQQWLELCQQLVAKNPYQNLLIYLQVTRGVTDVREHQLINTGQPTVYLNPIELQETLQVSDIKPLSVISSEDIRWQRCDIKTTALLANCLLKQKALESGADDTILVRNGLATEATASNLFMVKDGVLITPPLSKYLLAGVTRDFVIRLAEKHSIQVQQRDISEQELAQADEIWLTSSSREISPVIALNGAIIGTGEPGAMWLQMFEYFQALKQRLYAGQIESSEQI